ncbi:hypothetical protein ACWGN5_25850 [Streptomyces sp. NPDC055815]
MKSSNTPQPRKNGQPGGLVRARRAIAAARSRGVIPSDGGGTGRSDSND